MFWFFSIIGDIIGGVCLCLLIAIGIVAAILYIIRAMYPRHILTKTSILAGAVLFLLLLIQGILLCGAVSLKSKIENCTGFVQTYIQRYHKGTQTVIERMEVQEIADRLADEYPIVAHFINEIDIKSCDIEHVAETYTQGITDALNLYIWKRIGWSITFIIVGVFAIVKSGKNCGRTALSRKSSNYRDRMQTYRY